jgi:hypothetical protein
VLIKNTDKGIFFNDVTKKVLDDDLIIILGIYGSARATSSDGGEETEAE